MVCFAASVLCVSTLCSDNSLQSSRHALNEPLALSNRDFVPFLNHPVLQFKLSFWQSWILTQLSLQQTLEVLNWVEIRGLCWPIESVNTFPPEPLLGSICCVFWVAILLEYHGIHITQTQRASIVGTRFSLRMLMYILLVIIPFITDILPMPPHVMQPHTMMLLLPNFIVGRMILLVSPDALSQQYLHPSINSPVPVHLSKAEAVLAMLLCEKWVFS